MRHETSQTLIPKPPNKARSIKLMQPRPLQAWCIPNIVNITGGDQHITIRTILERHCSGNTLRLGTHSAHVLPTPRLRLGKPQLCKLTSADWINHHKLFYFPDCLATYKASGK